MKVNITIMKSVKKCIVCRINLTGQQTKFCSGRCKSQNGNTKYQLYEKQKERGFQKKLKLVNLKGGKCEHCGYDKNYSALTFHHSEPDDKSFEISMRECSNHTWDKLVEEASKCKLLCHNCHAEHHYPHYDKESLVAAV